VSLETTLDNFVNLRAPNQLLEERRLFTMSGNHASARKVMQRMARAPRSPPRTSKQSRSATVNASAMVANGRTQKAASPRAKTALRAVTGVQLAEVLESSPSKGSDVEDTTVSSVHQPLFTDGSDASEPLRRDHAHEDIHAQSPVEETTRFGANLGSKPPLRPCNPDLLPEHLPGKTSTVDAVENQS